MRLLRAVWFFSILSIVFAVYGIAAAHLYACMAWHAVRTEPEGAHRDRIGRWMLFWSDLLFTLFCRLMCITLDIRLPARRPSTMPVILMANHRGSLDTPILPLVLRRLGYRCALRGIAKRSFKNYPIVGHAVRMLMWAFVERKDEKETPEERAVRLARDLKRVTACAEGARVDGACMLIYPEGTLFKEPVPGSGLRYVLPPKIGGIAKICEIMDSRTVISLTIHWGDDLRDMTLMESAELFGRTITVVAEIIDGPGGRPVAEWITEDWRKKEALYAALEEHSA